MDHMSRIREQAILQSQSMAGKRAGKEHMVLEGSWEEDIVQEKVVVCKDNPDQPIAINASVESIPFSRTSDSQATAIESGPEKSTKRESVPMA
ncbi:hypothetical protein Tco_0443601 [Tanacetum coccineum]